MFERKRFECKHVGRLFVTFFLCLAPLGCEHQSDDLVNRYGTYPDQETQGLAKKIQPPQVSSIRINTGNQTVVTDPQTIKQLLLGLRHARETGILNQVCHVQVIGVRGNILIFENFALDGAQHALSPEFIIGLKQAGVRLEWEEKARRQQQRLTAVSTLGGVLLLCLIPLWLAGRRHVSKRSA